MQTLCPESGHQTAPNWPKIQKMTMTSQLPNMTASSNFFEVVLFLLLSLVTGPSFKGLTRNLEIGNTSVWVLPNIWRLERVMDTKFSMNVSNRMLLNAEKFQGYSFYCFWVIKGKPTRLGLKRSLWKFYIFDRNKCSISWKSPQPLLFIFLLLDIKYIFRKI